MRISLTLSAIGYMRGHSSILATPNLIFYSLVSLKYESLVRENGEGCLFLFVPVWASFRFTHILQFVFLSLLYLLNAYVRHPVVGHF